MLRCDHRDVSFRDDIFNLDLDKLQEILALPAHVENTAQSIETMAFTLEDFQDIRNQGQVSIFAQFTNLKEIIILGDTNPDLANKADTWNVIWHTLTPNGVGPDINALGDLGLTRLNDWTSLPLTLVAVNELAAWNNHLAINLGLASLTAIKILFAEF